MMNTMTAANAQELRSHYAAVHARLYSKRKAEPASEPPALPSYQPPPALDTAAQVRALRARYKERVAAKSNPSPLLCLMHAACDVFGVDIEALTGPRRDGVLAQARSLTMALAVRIGFTAAATGRRFGRHHTTVLEARNRHGATIDEALRGG